MMVMIYLLVFLTFLSLLDPEEGYHLAQPPCRIPIRRDRFEANIDLPRPVKAGST